MLAAANSSNLKGRDELKTFFRNKTQLSENHFAELINAMLNKRDDRFYGVWRAGQTYRKGDIVYSDCKLWEMTSTEICSRTEDPPEQSSHWKSGLKMLEDRVATLEEQIKTVQKDLQTLEQDLAQFKQQVTKFLSLLTLGLGFIFLWLFISASHLF